MASSGNQHCANCIGTLSFPIFGVPWSVCLSVCVLGTTVSSVKTAEQIRMPFGG